MSNQKAETNSRSLSQKVVIGLALIVVIALTGYWGNKTVQGYLGQSVLDSTGLQVLSLAQALEQVQNTDKLVLADMSAIWCPTCRRLDKEVFSNDLVKAEINKNYIFSRIEYDSTEGDLFRLKYNVVGFPTLLILDAEGKKLTSLPLIFEPVAFLENLQKVIKTVKT